MSSYSHNERKGEISRNVATREEMRRWKCPREQFEVFLHTRKKDVDLDATLTKAVDILIREKEFLIKSIGRITEYVIKQTDFAEHGILE
jgi:hypothetical protein